MQQNARGSNVNHNPKPVGLLTIRYDICPCLSDLFPVGLQFGQRVNRHSELAQL